jgi:uncharacterized membrane-anchored protein
MRKLVAVITLVLVLGVVNWSIYKKEQLLENGQIVYLQLAPVDPRSLMQGDYMALRFAIVSEIEKGLSHYRHSELKSNVEENVFDGFAQLTLDENRVGSFIKVTKTAYDKSNILDNEKAELIPAKFRERSGRIKIATNAYFFEEGKGLELEAAKYGLFRVDPSGELLLVSLVDDAFNVLGK